MIKIIHGIGNVVWVGKVKCVETPRRLIGKDCSSYCAIKSLGLCHKIACAPEERPDGKTVHYELIME